MASGEAVGTGGEVVVVLAGVVVGENEDKYRMSQKDSNLVTKLVRPLLTLDTTIHLSFMSRRHHVIIFSE